MAKGTYHVLLGARSPEKGNAALKELQSQKLAGSAEMLYVDVTNDDTINQATASVEKNYGKLDILVNNAAVAIPSGTLREQLQVAFNTNATGPIVLTETLAPLLRKGSDARIINVSSGVGSIDRRLDPTGALYKVHAYPYRTSKTALNMGSACQFVEYGEHGIKVFTYDPGFTVSNLSENNTAEKGARSVEESVWPLVDVLEGKRDDEVGKFLHNTGTYPW